MVNLPEFSFASTPTIVFGNGKLSTLATCIPPKAKQLVLITGDQSFKTSTFSSEVWDQLKSFIVHHYSCKGEPNPKFIDTIVSETKSKNIDCVIGVGGGSVLDAAKAVSAMLKEEGSVKEYLEGLGTKTPSGKKTPLIAIPTTAGTGSEVTKNAVISELGADGFKKSLRHNHYIPDVAIVDPLLTRECPPEITAASGMDAFTQLLESFLSTAGNVMSDALAFSGLEHIAQSLHNAFSHGKDLQARSNLSYAAMISGITLANAGLGLSHGFAQPLGSLFPIPHGVVCAVLMGSVNRKTVQKLMITNDSIYLRKYEKVAHLFIKQHNESAMHNINQFLDIIDEYITDFKIPKLSTFGVESSDFDAIIAKTGHKNHPVNFNNAELKQILFDCL